MISAPSRFRHTRRRERRDREALAGGFQISTTSIAAAWAKAADRVPRALHWLYGFDAGALAPDGA
ncbi:MAG TPA: hypothetical protein VJ770_25340 [Stellaceae bacterium]|nr:hypothetical protein [Stellaceae bacterium]